MDKQVRMEITHHFKRMMHKGEREANVNIILFVRKALKVVMRCTRGNEGKEYDSD